MSEKPTEQEAANDPIMKALRELSEAVGKLDERLDRIEQEQEAAKKWRDDVDLRLKEGDRRFATLDANVGLMMNATQALCRMRGLDEHAGKLGDAIDRISSNPPLRDEPTNPGRPSDA